MTTRYTEDHEYLRLDGTTGTVGTVATSAGTVVLHAESNRTLCLGFLRL